MGPNMMSSTIQSAERGSVLRAITVSRLLTMIAVFLLLCLIFHIASGGIFFTPRNITLLLRQGAIVSIVAMGVSILIVKGEIDLSIGSAVYLCGVAAAILHIQYQLPTVPTVLATVAIGLLLAAWQGAWTVVLGVPSFVVTLAGLLGFRGAGYYLTDAATLAPMSDSYTALSEGFVSLPFTYVLVGLVYVVGLAAILKGRSNAAGGYSTYVHAAALTIGCFCAAWVFAGYRGIPNAILWVAATWAILWFLMERTEFGRNAYLIGSNREAAYLSGISIKKHLFGGFLIMGVVYGIAGTLLTARLSASTPTSGLYLELDAIAAAVIGGTSLRGGIGTVGGAIVGALLLVTIDNGMSILNISSFVQMMVKGGVLLVALAVDTMLNRKR